MGRVSRLLDRWVPGGEFGNNVAKLASAEIAGQALTLAASPVLTRLYLPEEFGVLAVFTSVLSIAAVASALRYELAIPLPQDDATGASLLLVALATVTATSGLCAILVPIVGDEMAAMANAPALRPIIWLIPVGVAMAGFYKVLKYWAIRGRAFGRIAYTKFTQSGSKTATQLGLGFFGVGAEGLIVGQVIGRGAGSFSLGLLAWTKIKPLLRSLSLADIQAAALRYRRFPIFSSGSAILNEGGLHAPAFLLAMLYGPQVAGWFALSQKIVAVPMRLVSGAVAEVYFGAAPHLLEDNPVELRDLFRLTARRLLVFGGIPIAAAALGGPWLFDLVFGGNWGEAGLYTRILVGMFVVQFVVGPLSQTLNILERQDLQLYWDATRLGLVVFALVGAKWLGGGDMWAIGSYGVAMTLAYFLLFLMCWRTLESEIIARTAGSTANREALDETRRQGR